MSEVPTVWVETPDVVISSSTTIRSPNAYVNYKSSAKFNFTDKESYNPTC